MDARKLSIDGMSIHRINLSLGLVENQIVPEDNSDFHNYVRSLVNDVSLSKGGRHFKTRDNATQVISTILTIANNSVFENTDGIARRLLNEEIKVQQRIAHLGTEVHEGLLIQALIEDNDVRKFVICKAENLDFIERKTYNLSSGFPVKRKIYRSAQVILNPDNSISQILVDDFYSKGATYWWDSFLELNQKWDDSYNTKKAFECIDARILMPLKKDSPSDHTFLRNSSIKYFRTNGEFELEDYITQCFNDYEPVNPGLNITTLVDKVRVLPERIGFDKKFNLIPKEVTAKIKSIVKLTPDIDLLIKQDIDIDKYITPELRDNQKFLIIRTDEGYDAFRKQR